jgi:ubiquinone/menaquinone biosynthesis C-methylase UbiE
MNFNARAATSFTRAVDIPDRESLAPDIGNRAVAAAIACQSQGHAPGSPIGRQLTYLGRLIDLRVARRCLVVGCGPEPGAVRVLSDRGFSVTALEPEPALAAAASERIGDRARIIVATAETMPLGDESQDFIVCESVLEHVDSTHRALQELYRVLAPRGAVWITTTNRRAISPTGRTGEFRVPFFNWYPAIVQEAFVHHHLHHDPSLANFTPRPAVHWFTFDGLCRMGREAGFARFYSILDLVRPSDAAIAPSIVRRTVVRVARSRPWIRALALTQIGGTIIMVKR